MAFLALLLLNKEREYLSDRTQKFLVDGVMLLPINVNCSVPQGSVFGPVQFITYTEDVFAVFEKHEVRHHLYADDKQAYFDMYVQDINKARSTLQDCIADVRSWCSSRRLQLNTDKIKLIWFGSRQTLNKVSRSDLTLQFDSGTLNPVEVVRDLGVLLDAGLSMKQHVTRIASNVLLLPTAPTTADQIHCR